MILFSRMNQEQFNTVCEFFESTKKQLKEVAKELEKDFPNAEEQLSREFFRGCFSYDSKVAELTFLLGYCLLSDTLKNTDYKTAFIFCLDTVQEFLHSDFYRNNEGSDFDLLQFWLNRNTERLKKELSFYENERNS